MPDAIQGTLEINDSRFSCFTLEAKDPKGCNPYNPTFQYALKEGQYNLSISHNGAYVYVPYIDCKPYKRICICDFPKGEFKAGSIAVGTNYITPKMLGGGMEVMDALYDILGRRISDFKNGEAILIVQYANNCEVDAEKPYDDSYLDEMNAEYNFANL